MYLLFTDTQYCLFIVFCFVFSGRNFNVFLYYCNLLKTNKNCFSSLKKKTGNTIRIINLSYEVSETSFRRITDTDLKNGLNLYSRNYRTDSAFLNTLDKLIFLRKIAFICRHWNGTHQVNYRLAGNTKAYNFFALNSDERPTSDSMTLTSELGSTDYKLADGKYSDPSVNDQNRLAREILVTAGGIKFDIMVDSRVCFYNVGSWIQFIVEVW